MQSGSGFQAPNGKVALTVDFAGVTTNNVFEPNELDRICEIVEQKCGLAVADRTNAGAHAAMRRFCAERATSRDPETQEAVAMAALWCALYHPVHAAEFRRQVSAALQGKGRAHITTACDQRGNWAFAVGAGYANLQPSLARVPDRSATSGTNFEDLFGKPERLN